MTYLAPKTLALEYQSVAELNKMAAVQSNIPDRQLFESSLPVAERVLALVLECLLEPLPLGPCTSNNPPGSTILRGLHSPVSLFVRGNNSPGCSFVRGLFLSTPPLYIRLG